jgi:gas vesicle protein
MNTLLRKLAEWKGRSKAAQIIVFDGGAEVERTRSFFKGASCGAALTLGVFLLTAPNSRDELLIEEVNRREMRLKEANERLVQAMAVADMCLNTAESLERTFSSYQSFLGARVPTPREEAPPRR